MEDHFELIKPKMRGLFHAFAFVCTAVCALIFFIYSYFKDFDFAILIYLISQLLQFGISSCYHTVSWSPRVKRTFRLLDHMCIFILISGTQTSVIMSNSQMRSQPESKLMILISWIISILGILKIAIMNKLHNLFDLAVYMAHGAIVLPFYKLLKEINFLDKILLYSGGILYILGGIIYGIEKPNPVPHLFGYHEIFHIFTILANLCFGVVITREYILKFFGYA